MNETRSIRTYHRGPLAVHAALKRTPEGAALWQELWEQIPELMNENKLPTDFCLLPFGALVGKVHVTDCCPVETISPSLDWLEERLGDYSPGRFAWRADSGTVASVPVPWKGRQGFFTVDGGVHL